MSLSLPSIYRTPRSRVHYARLLEQRTHALKSSLPPSEEGLRDFLAVKNRRNRLAWQKKWWDLQ